MKNLTPIRALLPVVLLVVPLVVASPAQAGWCSDLVNRVFNPEPTSFHDSDFLAKTIPKKTVQQVSKATNAIIKNCPDQNCVFVGIGRSPTPFLAMLEALGYQDVYQVPLSNMRNHPGYDVSNEAFSDSTFFETSFATRLHSKNEEHLFERFQNFLPGSEELNGRRVIVFDYTLGGASLISAYRYLQYYFELKKISVDVVPVAILGRGSVTQRRLRAALSKQQMVLLAPGRNSLLSRIHEEFFHSFSRFPENAPLNQSLPIYSVHFRYNELVQYFQHTLGLNR